MMANTTRYSIRSAALCGGRRSSPSRRRRRHSRTGPTRASRVSCGARRGPVTPSVSHRISGRRSPAERQRRREQGPQRRVRTRILFAGLRLARGLQRRHHLRDACLPAADVRRQRRPRHRASRRTSLRLQRLQRHPRRTPCGIRRFIPATARHRGDHDHQFAATVAAPALALAAVVATVPAPAVAQPDTCISGFVWREARNGDTVCVTPDMRATIAQQNSTPGANKDPNAGSGPQSCSQGYVWREASTATPSA